MAMCLLSQGDTLMRLTFEVDDSTAKILHENLPYGSRKYIYKALIEGLAEKLVQDRVGTLATLVMKTWDLDELINKVGEK